MPDTHDYPMVQALGTGNLMHHARPAALPGRVETRCGMDGERTDRDGSFWCPDCLALERAKAGTHDERGGDEYVARANRQVDKCQQRGRAAVADVESLRNDVETLAELLAAATARAEKAEALAAELGDEWGVQSEDSERAQPCDDEDHARHLADRYSRFRLPGGERTQYRVVRRLATEWCDTETADASPDGRSGPVERSETSGGSRQANTSASPAAELSEPGPCDGDCDCDCQPGQPCLCPERDCYCGPCRVCGDTPQQASNDMTEDGR